MKDAIAQIKKTELVKPAKKAEKNAETKNEIPIDAMKETPVTVPPVATVKETPVVVTPIEVVKENPAKVPEQKVALTLEERIVDYIDKHPKGVRISEMEKPLGETRMKLGYLAKNLLEAGKVQKVDNIYFPVK